MGGVWRTPLLIAEGAQCDGVMGVKNRYPSKNGVPGVPGVPPRLKAKYFVALSLEHLFVLAGTPRVPRKKGVPV